MLKAIVSDMCYNHRHRKFFWVHVLMRGLMPIYAPSPVLPADKQASPVVEADDRCRWLDFLEDVLAWLRTVTPLFSQVSAERSALVDRGESLHRKMESDPEHGPPTLFQQIQNWWRDVKAWVKQHTPFNRPDRFKRLEAAFNAKFEDLAARLEDLETRFEALEARFEALEASVNAKIDGLRQDMIAGLEEARRERTVLRDMLTPLDAHHRGVNLERAARRNAVDYFKRYFETRYETEGVVRIDILCTDRNEPEHTQRFFRKWCDNARLYPQVKDPTLADFVMMVECLAWRIFIVAEVTTKADSSDVERAVSRAAWLRECLDANDKPYGVIPCIIALNWVSAEEPAIDTLRDAESLGVACLSGRYEDATDLASLRLTPAAHFDQRVARWSHGALQPLSLTPPYAPEDPITDREALEQALLRQVGQHSFYKRMSLAQQRYLIQIGLEDEDAQQAIYAQEWDRAFALASQALIRVMDRKI